MTVSRPDWMRLPPGVEVDEADVVRHLREIEEPSAVVPESIRDEFAATGEPSEASPPGAPPTCAFCREPIESIRLAHRRVAGWEKRREQGGTNAVRLRETLDEWAHDVCVDRAASGVSPLQGTLA